MQYTFKPTYLYIKTHNTTGLRYFGKTTKSDPHKYKGSGKRWSHHIKKYGYDVTTEIIGYFLNEDECKTAAINFSVENDISNSPVWANLCPENGVDGGYRANNYLKIYNTLPRSKSHNTSISVAKKDKSPSAESTKKRKITQAGQHKGIPKPLIICRLSDRKEMSATGFSSYIRSLNITQVVLYSVNSYPSTFETST